MMLRVHTQRDVALGLRSLRRVALAAGPSVAIQTPGLGVGATLRTVLERGTAEHSDRPHRGQASAVRASHLN